MDDYRRAIELRLKALEDKPNWERTEDDDIALETELLNLKLPMGEEIGKDLISKLWESPNARESFEVLNRVKLTPRQKEILREYVQESSESEDWLQEHGYSSPVQTPSLAPMPSLESKAKDMKGALRFDGEWRRNKDGTLQFIRTKEWRE